MDTGCEAKGIKNGNRYFDDELGEFGQREKQSQAATKSSWD
jgi:hypothetical protein